MLSFNEFVTENKVILDPTHKPKLSTAEEVLAYFVALDELDEVLNPMFVHAKEQAGYRFRDADRPLRDLCVTKREMRHDGPYGDYWYYPPEVEAVMDAVPYTMVSFKKLRKALDAAKNKYPDIYSAGMAYLAVWEPIAEKIKTVKGKTVKVTTKRAETKAKEAKAYERKKIDAKAMVKALEGHRSEYVREAKLRAAKHVEAVLKNIAKYDWNLSKYSPNSSRSVEGKIRMNLARSLTTPVKSSRTMREDEIVKRNPAGEKRFIDNAVKMAEDNFDAFVAKMVLKVGPVIDAKMTGTIWTNCNLTVTTDKGETEVWTTKAILNFSKYGKMFNQFPTRKKK